MEEDNPFKRKMAEDKARKQREAEQRQQEKEAAARAKAEAKRKAQRAVEDDWFMDGQDDVAPDSDDEFGMMDLSQAAAAAVPKPAAPSKFVVKNLIDWGECNEASESAPEPSPPPVRGGMASSSGASATSPFRAESASAADNFQFSSAAAPGHVANFSFTPVDAQEVERLRDECEHLRAMLNDANEMRNIEMDILKDEKQAVIDGLKKQSEDAQMQRDELQKLVDELRSSNEDEPQTSLPTLSSVPATAAHAALDKAQEQSLAMEQQRNELQRQLDELQAFSRTQSEELQLLRSAATPPPPAADEAMEHAKQQILEAQKERDELKRHLDELETKQQILEAHKERDELKRHLDELQAQSKCQAEELRTEMQKKLDEQVATGEGVKQQSLEFEKERDKLKQLLVELQAKSKCHTEELRTEMQRKLDQQNATMEGVKQRSLELENERNELKQLLDELQAHSRSQIEEPVALHAQAAAPPPPPLVEDPLGLFEEPISHSAEMAPLRKQAAGAEQKHVEQLHASNVIAEELRLEVAQLEHELATSKQEAAELRKEVTRSQAESARAVQPQELEQMQSALTSARASESQLKAHLEQLQQQMELDRAKLQGIAADNQPLQATLAQPAVPTSVAALLMELKALLLRSQHGVAETKPSDALAWNTASSIGDVETQLQDLRSMASALQSDLEAYQEREKDKADKHTASKIQDIRQNAEKQLSWLKRRTRMGPG